jgi:ATP/maltotriose-dependent transcriptional regulator MalT
MNFIYITGVLSFAFCFVIFFYFKWYIKRRTTAEALLAEYRSEVYKLIAELDSKTDRDMMLVEDRIKKLKAVLEDTDKRIAEYVREIERGRHGQELYTNLGKGIKAALNTPVETETRKQAEVRQTAQPPQLSIVRPNLDVQAAPQKQAPNPKPPSKRQIRAQIDELAAQGLSAPEIASRLDITIAEADLAMTLINRGKP